RYEELFNARPVACQTGLASQLPAYANGRDLWHACRSVISRRGRAFILPQSLAAAPAMSAGAYAMIVISSCP
ncbi:MAG: hypothetical protein ABI439_13270, partial [Rhodospirillales bacterium]